MRKLIEIEPSTYIPETVVPFWEILKASTLPLIRVEAEVKLNLAVSASKFAGRPYVPLNQLYPTDADGRPMTLLAQLNFDQIPALPGYPASGILQFFISATDPLYGMNFDDPTNQTTFKVIFHPVVDESTANVNIPTGDSDDNPTDFDPPITAEHALNFRIDEEFVSACDARFKQFFGKDFYEFWQEQGEDFYEIANPTGHKIGGYAYFMQEDPRCVRYQDYVLLLQIDSIGKHICWGDVGVGNFFIHPNDLAALDFSKVLYNWDCS